jgi:hypothetical protein
MSLTRFVPRSAAVVAGVALQGVMLASSLGAQALDSATVAGLRWRTVGPANFMGRLSDVVGIPSPSKTVFVAAAGGGIWKSTNNGTTWRPVFAHHLHGHAGDRPERYAAGLGRHG